MMPKSTKVNLPSASTNRFPGCMSAWKKPSRSAWRRKVWITACDRCLRSKPLASERRAVVQRRAVDPFQGQHVLGGAVPVHRRHAEVGIGLGVLRHLRQRGGLEPQIHLERDRAAQGGDGLDHAQPPGFRRQAFGLARGEGEGFEIDAEAPLDIGPQHLHGDGLAALGRDDLGAMHLRDRGRGDRRAERRVGLRQRLAQRGDDHRLGLGLRERRHLVLQRFQIARQRHADDVGPRRQELPELDVGRPELGQRGGEPASRAGAGRPLDQPRELDRGLRRPRQRRGIGQREHALAREHEAGAGEAGEMGDRGDHGCALS